MDIISVLKQDHRKVDELFSQIEACSDRALKTKEKLFIELKTELTVHAEAEESILYPRMQQLPELRLGAVEANEEHRLAKQLLAEISELDSASDQWNAKVKVLKSLVQHHVREEEGEFFKKLKSELDKEELRQMGAAVEEFKQNQDVRSRKPRVEDSDRRSSVQML